MEFNQNGTLEPGIHKMSWEEFYNFFSFSEHRKILLWGLEKIYFSLREIGATHFYIDGSFVTSKKYPGDWDACFDAPKHILYEIRDKYLLPSRNKIKERYGGDLFYVDSEADEYGLKFLDFFQQIKENPKKKKGIVELIY